MTEDPKHPIAKTKITLGDNIVERGDDPVLILPNRLKHGFGSIAVEPISLPEDPNKIDRVFVDCNSTTVPTYGLKSVERILLNHFDASKGDHVVAFETGNAKQGSESITLRQLKDGHLPFTSPIEEKNLTIKTTSYSQFRYFVVLDKDGAAKAAFRTPAGDHTQIWTSPHREAAGGAPGMVFQQMPGDNIETLYPANSEAAREAAKAIDKKIATGSAKTSVAELIGQIELHDPSSKNHFALSGQLPATRDMAAMRSKPTGPKIS